MSFFLVKNAPVASLWSLSLYKNIFRAREFQFENKIDKSIQGFAVQRAQCTFIVRNLNNGSLGDRCKPVLKSESSSI